MARPPRIPNLLPNEISAIYFVTLCVQNRLKVLATTKAWNACVSAAQRLDHWEVLAMIAMPDHLHLLVAPLLREKQVTDFTKWFKASVRKELKAEWTWQEGCFDRLLRFDESAAQKWEYMRYNPVRAGLVESSESWPYQSGLHNI